LPIADCRLPISKNHQRLFFRATRNFKPPFNRQSAIGNRQ